MKFSAVMFAAFFSCFLMQAQDRTTQRKTHFNLGESSVAVKGYDVVSYFSKTGPQKGKKNINLYYQGVTYFFATEGNKALFRSNPAAYEPEYGGWCAYAMGAKGEKVSIDPKTYKILNGKLYLFYNSYFNNTLKSWNADERNLKPMADENWKKIFH